LSFFLVADADTQAFREAAAKFRKRFMMPPEEKLVNYYSCRYCNFNNIF